MSSVQLVVPVVPAVPVSVSSVFSVPPASVHTSYRFIKDVEFNNLDLEHDFIDYDERIYEIEFNLKDIKNDSRVGWLIQYLEKFKISSNYSNIKNLIKDLVKSHFTTRVSKKLFHQYIFSIDDELNLVFRFFSTINKNEYEEEEEQNKIFTEKFECFLCRDDEKEQKTRRQCSNIHNDLICLTCLNKCSKCPFCNGDLIECNYNKELERLDKIEEAEEVIDLFLKELDEIVYRENHHIRNNKFFHNLMFPFSLTDYYMRFYGKYEKLITLIKEFFKTIDLNTDEIIFNEREEMTDLKLNLVEILLNHFYEKPDTSTYEENYKYKTFIMFYLNLAYKRDNDDFKFFVIPYDYPLKRNLTELDKYIKILSLIMPKDQDETNKIVNKDITDFLNDIKKTNNTKEEINIFYQNKKYNYKLSNPCPDSLNIYIIEKEKTTNNKYRYNEEYKHIKLYVIEEEKILDNIDDYFKNNYFTYTDEQIYKIKDIIDNNIMKITPNFILFDTLNKFRNNNKNDILKLSEVEDFYDFYFKEEIGGGELKKIYSYLEFNNKIECLYFEYSLYTSNTLKEKYYLKSDDGEEINFILFNKYFSSHFNDLNRSYTPINTDALKKIIKRNIEIESDDESDDEPLIMPNIQARPDDSDDDDEGPYNITHTTTHNF